MTADHLPVPVAAFGPWASLALDVHELTVQGRQAQCLAAADEMEGIAGILGDRCTARSIRLARMYALTYLGRLPEALAVGEALIAPDRHTPRQRSMHAKILADTGEVLLKMGRIDEGLQHVARALVLLDTVPRHSIRYFSAMASVCEAAKAAELFELADECLRAAASSVDPTDIYGTSIVLQRAELHLEWGLRLEQLGHSEQAALRYLASVDMLEHGLEDKSGAPAAQALRAVGLAKTGRDAEAATIIHGWLLPLRQAHQNHEARLLHLAHGTVLRHAGDLRGARREFTAAEELTANANQRLIFQYELALLAAADGPQEAVKPLLTALHGQVAMLWKLRLDRRTMLRQACRRVALEAARTRADREATLDVLTSLSNRRVFERRMDLPAGGDVLLLIDVDRFKNINDSYSHSIGDEVLKEIAAVLQAHCRDDDVAIRLGGDEFALFLTGGAHAADKVADRIRRAIADRDWSMIARGLRVTLSMGLTEGSGGDTGRDLYERSDKNLYTAKRSGRNRIATA